MILNLSFFKNRIIAAVLVLMLAFLLCVSFVRAEDEVKNADTLQSRLSFLVQKGHDCDEGSEQTREIIIPETFSDVYTNYNELQKAQGYDLAKYCGERVTHYTYIVNSYVGEDEVYAHLLVLDGRVIGGDISSARLDGFMEGFGGERI